MGKKKAVETDYRQILRNMGIRLEPVKDTRPRTVDELRNDDKFYPSMENMRIKYHLDTWNDVVKESDRENAKDFPLCEQVGFDMCRWGVKVKAIDEVKFLDAIEKHSKTGAEPPYPFVETVRASSDGSNAVILPWNNRNFKKISIILSPYEEFSFQHSNLTQKKTEGVEVRPKEILQLSTRERPKENYEEVGNLTNYAYEEQKEIILDSIKKLEDEFDVSIDFKSVYLLYVELNVTCVEFAPFHTIKRPIAYFRDYLPDYYSISQYSNMAYHPILHEKLDHTIIRENYYSQTVNTINAQCGSVEIAIYDKAYETIEALKKSRNCRLFFAGIDTGSDGTSYYSLVRLEFRIKKKNPLKDYFFYDNAEKKKGNSPSPRFYELSQKRIEDVYCNLVDKFFGQSYEKYVKDSEERLSSLIEGINPKYERKWAENLLKNIISNEIHTDGSPLIIEDTDMIGIIKKNPSFSKHPGHHWEKIQKALSEDNTYYSRVFSNNYYIINSFFDNFLRLEHLKKDRIIRYIVLEN